MINIKVHIHLVHSSSFSLSFLQFPLFLLPNEFFLLFIFFVSDPSGIIFFFLLRCKPSLHVLRGIAVWVTIWQIISPTHVSDLLVIESVLIIVRGNELFHRPQRFWIFNKLSLLGFLLWLGLRHNPLIVTSFMLLWILFLLILTKILAISKFIVRKFLLMNVTLRLKLFFSLNQLLFLSNPLLFFKLLNHLNFFLSWHLFQILVLFFIEFILFLHLSSSKLFLYHFDFLYLLIDSNLSFVFLTDGLCFNHHIFGFIWTHSGSFRGTLVFFTANVTLDIGLRVSHTHNIISITYLLLLCKQKLLFE